MGTHIARYMKDLMEDDEDAYKRQFSRYIKYGITADEVRVNCLFLYTVCVGVWYFELVLVFILFFIIPLPHHYYTCLNAFLLSQVEELYKKAHANIRADPSALPKKTKEASVVNFLLRLIYSFAVLHCSMWKSEGGLYTFFYFQVTKKRWNAKRLTYKQRKAAVAEKKAAWLAKIERGEASVDQLNN